MTREEALQRLKTTDACDSELCKALEMAIKALEQEPCGDCISREAVIKTITEWFFSKEFHYTNASEYLRKRLDELPPVTPQPKIGQWKWNFHCSLCNNIGERYYDYCPGCGAKMQEVEE